MASRMKKALIWLCSVITIGEIWNSPNAIKHLKERSVVMIEVNGSFSVHNQVRDMGRKLMWDRAGLDQSKFTCGNKKKL